jgi:hypothetical protein
LYGALFLLSSWEGTGDFQGLFLPIALAAAFGLPLGVALAIEGHRVRNGTGSRLRVGAMAGVASLVVLVGLVGYVRGFTVDPLVAYVLAVVPYVAAPVTAVTRWIGDSQGSWSPGAANIALAASLLALSAGLILGSIPWRPPTEA